MSTTTKSPRRVLLFAYLVGQLTFRDYAHKYSPKKFTQPQLFACLVLKEFLRLDYRKLAALLGDCNDLRAAIDLTITPHFTTFQKAADRLLLVADVCKLLEATLDVARVQGRLKKRCDLAALDGTGFEAHHVSHYFVIRGRRAARSPPLDSRKKSGEFSPRGRQPLRDRYNRTGMLLRRRRSP